LTSIINTSGTVQERYGYNAFGTSRVMNASFVVQSSSSYNWETRFAAYRWDSESGLYQVRYRYYHPLLGTWINRDPLGDHDNWRKLALSRRIPKQIANSPVESIIGPNLYIFTSNSPISYTDSDGRIVLIPIVIGGVIGGIWGGVTGGWDGLWRGALAGSVGGFVGAALAPVMPAALAGAVGGGTGSLWGQWLNGQDPYTPAGSAKILTACALGGFFGRLGEKIVDAGNPNFGEIMSAAGAGGSGTAGDTVIDTIDKLFDATERIPVAGGWREYLEP
jgi:RHS repeat-associated protein